MVAFAIAWNTKMDLNAVEQLKNVLSSMSIEKDQIIYEEGEPVGDGYILSIGKVRLFKSSSNGKLTEKQTVNSMQVFGVWNSILGNNVRLFTAKALEKSSALIIPKATLDKKLSTLDPFLRLLFRQALSTSENFE
tara:strand:- start:90 stop:494 length:405 start_codon:yes stop_codon:yes gene_type:complete